MNFMEYVEEGRKYKILNWKPLEGAPNVFVHNRVSAYLWLFGDQISDANIQRYLPRYRIVDSGSSIPVVGTDQRLRYVFDSGKISTIVWWAWVCSEKPFDYVNSSPPPLDWPDSFPLVESRIRVKHILAFPSGEHRVGGIIECSSFALGGIGMYGSAIQEFLSKHSG